MGAWEYYKLSVAVQIHLGVQINKGVLSNWLARLTVNQVRKACRFEPYRSHKKDK